MTIPVQSAARGAVAEGDCEREGGCVSCPQGACACLGACPGSSSAQRVAKGRGPEGTKPS